MRRIIVACDGTGQSSSRGTHSFSSNINRLCHAFRIDGDVTQIVFYQSGIGTATISEAYTNYAAGTGAGIADNVSDAYQFVLNNYLPGDEIYIFGFSRGAYTARILANFIIRLGILRTTYSWMLKKAWQAYTEGPKLGEKDGHTPFDEYINTMEGYIRKYDKPGMERSQRTNIKVVGCFDTVGSVLNGEFYDPRLVAVNVRGTEYKIENAFHALAIDEYRKPFTPTLWYKTPETKGTRLEQIWFSGVHSNVGGGYADQICADVALLWMIDRCSPYLDFDPVYLKDAVIALNHHPETIHSKDREAQGFRKEYVPWGCGRIQDSFHKGVHKFGGKKTRSPGEYGTSFDTTGQLSVGTEERMHSSVRARWEASLLKNAEPGFQLPESMAGFSPQETNGKWKWIRPAGEGSWVPWKYPTPEVIVEEEDFSTDSTTWEWILRYGRK